MGAAAAAPASKLVVVQVQPPLDKVLLVASQEEVYLVPVAVEPVA
jgi:hypothetical protein